jgi:hypothetical protein
MHSCIHAVWAGWSAKSWTHFPACWIHDAIFLRLLHNRTNLCFCLQAQTAENKLDTWHQQSACESRQLVQHYGVAQTAKQAAAEGNGKCSFNAVVGATPWPTWLPAGGMRMLSFISLTPGGRSFMYQG